MTTHLFKLPDDFAVPHGAEFADEIIRREDMHLEFGGMRTPAFQYVKMVPLSELEDGKIEHIGPGVDDVLQGAQLPLGIVVKVAGQKMQPDFESIFELRIHDALNSVSGVWHVGDRDKIWIRISKKAKEKGLRIKHLGDIIYAMLCERYSGFVDKAEVYLYTKEATVSAFLKEAISAYGEREERLADFTDDDTDTFYSCLFCQPFTPKHICIITPERPGLCGRYSWLEGKANHQLEPMDVNRPVQKGKALDEVKGQWQGVNDYVATATEGAISRLNIYSMMEHPTSSCSCHECLSVRLPMANGVMIVNREYQGMTPYEKMTFSKLAGEFTLDGKQIPGVIAHSKRYISRRKYISADGGHPRIVWMPKALKDEIEIALTKTAGIENFVDMIADEREVTTEGEVLEYMRKVAHPALAMGSMVL